jgi:hypothetical protein
MTLPAGLANIGGAKMTEHESASAPPQGLLKLTGAGSVGANAALQTPASNQQPSWQAFLNAFGMTNLQIKLAQFQSAHDEGSGAKLTSSSESHREQQTSIDTSASRKSKSSSDHRASAASPRTENTDSPSTVNAQATTVVFQQQSPLVTPGPSAIQGATHSVGSDSPFNLSKGSSPSSQLDGSIPSLAQGAPGIDPLSIASTKTPDRGSPSLRTAAERETTPIRATDAGDASMEPDASTSALADGAKAAPPNQESPAQASSHTPIAREAPAAMQAPEIIPGARNMSSTESSALSSEPGAASAATDAVAQLHSASFGNAMREPPSTRRVSAPLAVSAKAGEAFSVHSGAAQAQMPGPEAGLGSVSARNAGNAPQYTGPLSPGSPTPSAPNGTPGIDETFAALDADSGAHTWIHAGSNSAEAGYQDPSLGWVGVRAHIDGSGVHAAVVPGSEEASRILGSHMDGLSRYLTEHHTPVEMLTMAAGKEMGNGQGAEFMGNGQGSGQRQGQETNPHAQQGSDYQSEIYGRTSEPESVTAGSLAAAPQIDPAIGGGFISVMA